MKTIFLSFSVTDSSVTDFFLELSNKLSKNNKIIIITDRLEKTIITNSNIEIFKWPSTRPTKFKDFVFVCKLIKKYRPSLMISVFGSVNMFTISSFLLNVKNRVAWCNTLSTQFKAKKIKQWRKAIIYKMCTHISVNSKSVKLDLIENFGVSANKLHVVYNAVKMPYLEKELQANKIVYVGRMHPSKGIDTLLKAMPDVIKEFPEIQLNIIGGNLDSDIAKKYLEMTSFLNINDNVFFLGNQSKEVVLKEFSSSYFSVVPSVTEAFGFVVIESFSVKTPVIGSNSTGIAEIIRDNKDGFLFETQNSKDLSEKMLLLLKDIELRKEFSDNCHKRFLDNFELQKSIENVSNMFQNML